MAADEYEVKVSFGTAVPGRAISAESAEVSSEGDSEFKSFESLSRRLMAVPKSELDQQREG